MWPFPKPFADVVRRQLDLFAVESAALLGELDRALEAYDRAGPGAAEERYADYLELVDDARDRVRDIRDSYSLGLDDAKAGEYARAFDRELRRRLPDLAFELEHDVPDD